MDDDNLPFFETFEPMDSAAIASYCRNDPDLIARTQRLDPYIYQAERDIDHTRYIVSAVIAGPEWEEARALANLAFLRAEYSLRDML